MSISTWRSQSGFTLPEVIMVVAVMAIVSAMAFPDIVSFFKRQSVEQEKIIQGGIIKALDAYSKSRTADFTAGGNNAADMVTVPLGEATAAGLVIEQDPATCAAAGGWGNTLSGYSNLSAEEICNDVWGQARVYTVARDMLSYRDGQFTTYYVTLFSKGENKVTDTTGSWFDAASYGTFNSLGDDHLAKFSDVKLKTELFEETLRRMDRIVEALDRYAQARYNEALLIDEDAVGYKLFYPPETGDYSDTIDRPGPVAGGQGVWYGQKVREDTEQATGGIMSLDSGSDLEQRRPAMEALMRIIGLPQEFCCDALTGEPFYYYSNPIIAPGANGCAGAVRRVEPPYMPPKLTIEPLDCN